MTVVFFNYRFRLSILQKIPSNK